MPKPSSKQPDSLKLTRADARKVKKVATGPLLGPIPGDSATGPLASVAATPSLLGSIQQVRARLAAAELPASNGTTPGTP